ncbi:hypothetical protein ACWDBD_17260 [Streptomyces sp. NPDC001118]
MPSTARTAEPAAWPDGVIARYLTVGGAHVDLTEAANEITGTCHGCPDENHRFDFDPMCEGLRMVSFAKSQASTWAQSHAEKCRAMPRPTA